MKTANLTGAPLDYWTARAEGIPADQLSIRPVPHTDDTICVQERRSGVSASPTTVCLDYSTNWARGGPLIEKCKADLTYSGPGDWSVHLTDAAGNGSTPLIAICRTVVHAAFGDEVEEMPGAASLRRSEPRPD